MAREMMDYVHMQAGHTHEIAARPTILVVGEVPPTRMMRNLGRLDNGGFFKLVQVAGAEASELSAKEQIERSIRRHKPRAIILRPAAYSREVSPAVFDALPHDVLVGNLGIGVDHLDGIKAHPKVKIIAQAMVPTKKLKRPGNSPIAVAELTVFLANCLRRPLHEAASLGRIAEGQHYHNQHAGLLNSRLLKGTHWLCLGAGNQVRALLPLLRAYGVRRATVWHTRGAGSWTESRVSSLLSEMGMVPTAQAVAADHNSFEATFGTRFSVHGVGDYRPAAGRADVVSIHVKSDDPENPLLRVNGEFLAALKAQAHLINVARGHLVEEESVIIDALENGKLGGFAADVIHPKAETDRDPSKSGLWQKYQRSPGGLAALRHGVGLPRLVLLPHLGGATVEVFEPFTCEVIAKVLDGLALPDWRRWLLDRRAG